MVVEWFCVHNITIQVATVVKLIEIGFIACMGICVLKWEGTAAETRRSLERGRFWLRGDEVVSLTGQPPQLDCDNAL